MVAKRTESHAQNKLNNHPVGDRGARKRTDEPPNPDELPVLMAFTSVTFAVFMVITLAGLFFVIKIGLCRCQRKP